MQESLVVRGFNLLLSREYIERFFVALDRTCSLGCTGYSAKLSAL